MRLAASIALTWARPRGRRLARLARGLADARRAPAAWQTLAAQPRPGWLLLLLAHLANGHSRVSLR
jgi:hypothetical protein